ncbi:hypothetical protein BC828DRAFT_379498 [Blastocladiella britannica]|nr:hypothetical protein BC828DRAFT_379498 [Blastocladiella britannica]
MKLHPRITAITTAEASLLHHRTAIRRVQHRMRSSTTTLHLGSATAAMMLYLLTFVALTHATSAPLDPSVQVLTANDLPSCPVAVVSAMNTCLLNRAQEQKQQCVPLNVPSAIAAYMRCQCSVQHRTYVCLNRPGCISPLGLGAPNSSPMTFPPTDPTTKITNGLVPPIAQKKLVTGMTISQWCGGAAAQGVKGLSIQGSEVWVDLDAGSTGTTSELAPTAAKDITQFSSGDHMSSASGLEALVVAAVVGLLGA